MCTQHCTESPTYKLQLLLWNTPSRLVTGEIFYPQARLACRNVKTDQEVLLVLQVVVVPLSGVQQSVYTAAETLPSPAVPYSQNNKPTQ